MRIKKLFNSIFLVLCDHLKYSLDRLYFFIFDRVVFRRFGVFNRITDRCCRLDRVLRTCKIMYNESLIDSAFMKWTDIFFLVCAKLGVNYRTAWMLYNAPIAREYPKIEVFQDKLVRYSKCWTLPRLIELHRNSGALLDYYNFAKRTEEQMGD